jgi:hypothetical protein
VSVAADRATSQAKVASDSAKVVAGQLGKATSEAVGTAATAVSDPANQAKAKVTARAGIVKAKSGLSGMIDRIDPGLMADLVIKSTTLQEKANKSLREKGSPYRINEITITAGIPPDVAFTIGRIDVLEENPSAIEPSTMVDAPIDAEPEGDGEHAADLDGPDPLAVPVEGATAAGSLDLTNGLGPLLGGDPASDDPIPELVATD